MKTTNLCGWQMWKLCIWCTFHQNLQHRNVIYCNVGKQKKGRGSRDHRVPPPFSCLLGEFSISYSFFLSECASLCRYRVALKQSIILSTKAWSLPIKRWLLLPNYFNAVIISILTRWVGKECGWRIAAEGWILHRSDAWTPAAYKTA